MDGVNRMSYQTILVTNTTHGVIITLNRLEQKNALNTTLVDELITAFDEAEKNPAIHVIILRGQQGVFCTGMEV